MTPLSNNFQISKSILSLHSFVSFFQEILSSLYDYQWTLYDLQYLFLFVLDCFLLHIIEFPGLIVKLFIIVSFAIGLCFRKSRLFILPFLPIATWLILFYSCRFIPGERRPHIYVSVLPALENILYGDNLSAIIAKHTNVVKDLLAWFPYGVLHFTLPFITSTGLWWFGPPGILAVFARAFGYMNIAGVLTQLLFPCSPPWYEYTYGMNTPAKYSMPGHPGGLARIDALFSSHTYTTTFSGSPMVFGAFPSLHSGCAIIQALFISYVIPKSRIFCIAYVMWIWWACMYLTHHYMVDLVGGGIYAVMSFWFSWKWLPTVRYELSNRRDYIKDNLLPRTVDDTERTPMYARIVSPSSRDASIDMDSQVIGDKNAELSISLELYDSNDELDLGKGIHHYQHPNIVAASVSIDDSDDIEAR